MVPKGAGAVCGIERYFQKLIQGTKPAMDWKRFFGRDYRSAERQAVLCSGLAQANVTAWVNAMDMFNDWLLKALFRRDKTLGSVSTLGKLGSMMHQRPQGTGGTRCRRVRKRMVMARFGRRSRYRACPNSCSSVDLSRETATFCTDPLTSPTARHWVARTELGGFVDHAARWPKYCSPGQYSCPNEPGGAAPADRPGLARRGAESAGY
jgi:hypothetical protein